MNPMLLLKSLLPGLLPLVIFVGADAVFGETVGLLVGIGTGVAEFAYTLIKDRKADPFVAADTILLALAGGLSLLLRDAIFFKLKPAIIEFVLAVAMGGMLVLPPSYLKGYIGRQLRGVAIPDSAMPAMQRSLRFMPRSSLRSAHQTRGGMWKGTCRELAGYASLVCRSGLRASWRCQAASDLRLVNRLGSWGRPAPTYRTQSRRPTLARWLGKSRPIPRPS